MKIYLDIDGVIVDHNFGEPLPNVREFLKYVYKKSNGRVYWLSTLKERSSSYIEDALQPIMDHELLTLLKKIKPSPWEEYKTEGIDLKEDFLWFDDNTHPFEYKVLKELGKEKSWIKVDNNLEKIFNMLEGRVCFCSNPDCGKCLGINCMDDDCEIHSLTRKRQFRKQMFFDKIGRDLFIKAKSLVSDEQDFSAIFLQENLNIDYNYALKIKEQIKEERDEQKFEEAKKLVIEKGSASPSFIHRKLEIGHNHAARIFMRLQREGMISKTTPYKVL